MSRSNHRPQTHPRCTVPGGLWHRLPVVCAGLQYCRSLSYRHPHETSVSTRLYGIGLYFAVFSSANSYQGITKAFHLLNESAILFVREVKGSTFVCRKPTEQVLLSWHIPIFLPTNSLPESSSFVQRFIALKCKIFLRDFSAACRKFLCLFSWQTESTCQCTQTVYCSLSVRNSASQ